MKERIQVFITDSNIKRFIWLLPLIALTVQFFANRSFYLDEASLAMNILERDFTSLMIPLNREQVTPLLFLLVSKAMSFVFGNSDVVFRILPFVSSVIAVWLYFRLLKKTVGSALSLTLLLLALNTFFIRYGTEFKQYALEFLFTVVFYFIVYKRIKTDKISWGAICLILIGFFFTHHLILLLTALLVSLVIYRIVSSKKIRLNSRDYFAITACFALFVVQYYLQYLGHPNKGIQTDFWQYAFMPYDFWNLDFYLWFVQRFSVVFYKLFHYSFYLDEGLRYKLLVLPLSTLLIIMTGCFQLWKQKKTFLLLLVTTPLFIHLFISSLQLYPFASRILVYTFPNLIFLLGIGLYHFFTKGLVWKVIAGAYLLTYFASFLYNYPFKNEEVKSGLEFVSKNASEEDLLYVFRDITDVVDFYTISEQIDIYRKNIVFGTYNVKHPELIHNDIQKICGRKGFAIFANSNSNQSRNSLFHLNKDILNGRYFSETDESDFVKKMGIQKVISFKGTNVYTLAQSSCE